MQNQEKREREEAFQRDLFKAIVIEPPGVIVNNLVNDFSQRVYIGKKFSKATVRRKVERLGAEGWLVIRNQILIYPTEKCKKLVGRTQPPVKPEADIHE